MNLHAYPRLRDFVSALKITHHDMGGQILVILGGRHRKQQKRIFTTQGRAGKAGRWPSLSARYKAKKKELFGRKKMLQLTGETHKRFTKKSHPGYIQAYVPGGGEGKGTFLFGASSELAKVHLLGLASAAPESKHPELFRGKPPNLPKRDMISKTNDQAREFDADLKEWYIKKRVPQVLKAHGLILKNTKPRK